MIFVDTLNDYKSEVRKAVTQLFNKAYKKQTDSGDMLLVMEHAFYNKDYESIGAPYVIGPDIIGYAEDTIMEFVSEQLLYAIKKGERNYFYKQIGLNNQEYLMKEKYSVHLDMMIYLKFWESDIILKRLYQLARLANGEDYNWYLTIQSKSKTIRNYIKNNIIKSCPLMYNLIKEIYIPQLRNAFAHSQYTFIFPRQITFANYDPSNFHLLHRMTFDEFYILFHKTIVLHFEIDRQMHLFEKKYIKFSDEHHNGVAVRHIRPDGSSFLRFKKFEPNVPRWTDTEVLLK